MAEAESFLPVPPPRPLSSFIGRQAEIEALKRLLAGTGLVTLTGPGGGGKTRLAIEVARETAARYTDRTAFADLSPLRDAAAALEGMRDPTLRLELLAAARACARATGVRYAEAPSTPAGDAERASPLGARRAGGPGGLGERPEIARRLAISERTVDAHLAQLRGQLGLRNRAQVTAWAMSRGLVGAPPADVPAGDA